MNYKYSPKNGFTLIEILVVVIILGILASVIVPQFSTATKESRDNMVKENLRTLRTQIGIYRAQHLDSSPGVDNGGNVDADLFVAQLTSYTNLLGDCNDEKTVEFCYGPYLSRIPVNPINEKENILVADELPDGASDNFGWGYIPDDNLLFADCAGTDMDGVSYFDY